MMFRKEHKPMWEECLDGGTWIIHFKKRENELLNKKWEALLLGLFHIGLFYSMYRRRV